MIMMMVVVMLEITLIVVMLECDDDDVGGEDDDIVQTQDNTFEGCLFCSCAAMEKTPSILEIHTDDMR